MRLRRRRQAGADPGSEPGAASRRGKRHWLRWTSLAVVIVVAGGTLGVYAKYRQVYDSIKKVPLTDLGKRPPQYSTTSENILVYGSDSRAGLSAHQQYLLHTGDDQTDNTDTIMLIHMSPGRHLVTVLSIPRDTMVPMYQCAAGTSYPGQQADPGQYVQINSLLAAGGPSCLFKTVEQQTGIYISHFIGIGMLGFVNVINDLGGVNVCVPFKVNDSMSGLDLASGKDHITGVQALAFWRTREDIGTGSDLERIQRDQFMSAQLVKAVLGSRLLDSPLKLLKVITDAASQMTTDNAMSPSDLFDIGESLRSLNSQNVQFITAPNEPFPADPGRVQLAEPQASEVFSAIAHDVTVPKTAPVPTTTPTAGAQVLTTSPSKVKVDVLNGSGAQGVAGQAATALSDRGFDVTGTSDAATFSYTNSVIEYAATADVPAVNTLKAELTGVTVQQDASLVPGTVQLILGSDYAGLTPRATATAAPSASPSAPASPSASGTATGSASPGSGMSSAVANLAQQNNGITAAAGCASDSSAFSGPLSP
ncbi:MAG TPA: LCP family protein [Streptosporangiaceae bacterium]